MVIFLANPVPTLGEASASAAEQQQIRFFGKTSVGGSEFLPVPIYLLDEVPNDVRTE